MKIVGFESTKCLMGFAPCPPTESVPAMGSELRSASLVGALRHFLALNREQERLLEGFRHPAQKTRGIGTVNQTMIIGQ